MSPCRPRPAFTLLEVILALSLATIVLGLIATAIYVHLGVTEKGRWQVEEAQLARALLQTIADDLRNALPFTPAASASSASSNSSDAAGTSTSLGTPYSGGIYGSTQELQVETSRRPRRNRLPLTEPAVDGTQPARLSDIRTVIYSLGDPGVTAPTERGASSDLQAGLYRRELDRAEFLWATQQGGIDDLDQATELLASEVVELQFTYYDGSTASEQWDSTEQKKLPSAVRVALSIRRGRPKTPPPDPTAAEDSLPVLYDILVDLPNSRVPAKQAPQSQTSSTTTTKQGAPNE